MDDSDCQLPGETDEYGQSYCGRLDAECCAKARLRNFKAVEAIVASWGEERSARPSSTLPPHGR